MAGLGWIADHPARGRQPPADRSSGRHAYIVDDDAGFQHSLAELLSLEKWDVRCFAGGEDFLREIEQLPPGVLLLDLRMPDSSGLAVMQAGESSLEQHAIIMLTGHGDVQAAVAALKAGATDFIEKPFAAEVLLKSMERAYTGLDERAQRVTARKLVANLSNRESEVLHALIKGGSNKTIASDLGISVRTAEMHRARLLDKLGARTVAEAIHYALLANFRSDAV